MLENDTKTPYIQRLKNEFHDWKMKVTEVQVKCDKLKKENKSLKDELLTPKVEEK